jgi:hypothetical protein
MVDISWDIKEKKGQGEGANQRCVKKEESAQGIDYLYIDE